jgi:EAL domain-containing protein (putative c-di-GMP-specific phosphodiesterase class I)
MSLLLGRRTTERCRKVGPTGRPVRRSYGIPRYREDQLRAAIDEEQFDIYYQPLVNLTSGRIESVEALLRWNDPEDGLVLPSRFLPALEDMGLLARVGDWVLGRAVEDCERWSRRGLPPFRVAVNISAVQLRRKGFVEDLLELRGAGIRIVLDDLGTGYSSLGLLSQLPVDLLKIDRSFIKGLPDDPASRVLAESIIRLASAFQLITVAEGVETERQLDAVRKLGCSLLQGYLHHAPMPRRDLEGMLAEGSRSRTYQEASGAPSRV